MGDRVRRAGIFARATFFRNISIALAKELTVICSAMEINIWEVIGPRKTKPLSYIPFYPGRGLGGHCIFESSHSILFGKLGSLTNIPASQT